MATGSYIGVTPGSGAKLSTGPTYTEGGNVIQDEKVILGEQYLPTYSVLGLGQSIATNGQHVLYLMAGASLKLHIFRIAIRQVAAATAAATAPVQVLRLTSADTGGAVVAPLPNDPSDPVPSSTCGVAPTAAGTIGNAAGPQMMRLGCAAAQPLNATNAVEWIAPAHLKGIVVPAGTANGLLIYVGTGVAGATVDILIEYLESPF